jgi:hypothetical protein
MSYIKDRKDRKTLVKKKITLFDKEKTKGYVEHNTTVQGTFLPTAVLPSLVKFIFGNCPQLQEKPVRDWEEEDDQEFLAEFYANDFVVHLFQNSYGEGSTLRIKRDDVAGGSYSTLGFLLPGYVHTKNNLEDALEEEQINVLFRPDDTLFPTKRLRTKKAREEDVREEEEEEYEREPEAESASLLEVLREGTQEWEVAQMLKNARGFLSTVRIAERLGKEKEDASSICSRLARKGVAIPASSSSARTGNYRLAEKYRSNDQRDEVVRVDRGR